MKSDASLQKQYEGSASGTKQENSLTDPSTFEFDDEHRGEFTWMEMFNMQAETLRTVRNTLKVPDGVHICEYATLLMNELQILRDASHSLDDEYAPNAPVKGYSPIPPMVTTASPTLTTFPAVLSVQETFRLDVPSEIARTNSWIYPFIKETPELYSGKVLMTYNTANKQTTIKADELLFTNNPNESTRCTLGDAVTSELTIEDKADRAQYDYLIQAFINSFNGTAIIPDNTEPAALSHDEAYDKAMKAIS